MAKLQHRAVDETLSLSRRNFLIGIAGTCVAFGFAPVEAMAVAAPESERSAFEPSPNSSKARAGGAFTVTFVTIGAMLIRFYPRQARYQQSP